MWNETEALRSGREIDKEVEVHKLRRRRRSSKAWHGVGSLDSGGRDFWSRGRGVGGGRSQRELGERERAPDSQRLDGVKN